MHTNPEVVTPNKAEAAPVVSVSAGISRDDLKALSTFVSTDPERSELSRVWVQRFGDSLYWQATNGHVALVVRSKMDEDADMAMPPKVAYQIPAPAMKTLTAGRKGFEVHMRWTDESFISWVNGTETIYRLATDEQPPSLMYIVQRALQGVEHEPAEHSSFGASYMERFGKVAKLLCFSSTHEAPSMEISWNTRGNEDATLVHFHGRDDVLGLWMPIRGAAESNHDWSDWKDCEA